MMPSPIVFFLPLAIFTIAHAIPRWMPCQNPNACPNLEPPWYTKTTAPTLCTTPSSIPTPTVMICQNPNACPDQTSSQKSLPPKAYTLKVPTSQIDHILVNSADCSSHCSKHISHPRQCFRYTHEMPPWASAWEDQYHTPVYETYACLVCLNLPAMMATPTHPEFGNDQRETQDLVNAIYSVSTGAGIPPQLAFSMALQESLGSVRPHSGDQGASRGTFQVQIPGAVTCFQTPVGSCSTVQIKTMVSLGVCGQVSCQAPYQRPGIASYWTQNAGSIGLIARGYNSGSVYDWNDLTVVQFGTNSYSSDIVNRMMGRVVAGFFTRTCCARCGEGRNVLEVKTCGPVDGSMSDFCGDERYSFHGKIG